MNDPVGVEGIIDNAFGAKTLMRAKIWLMAAMGSTYSALSFKATKGILAADGREKRLSSSGMVTVDRLT